MDVLEPISFAVSEPMLEEIKRLAAERGCNRSEILRVLVAEGMGAIGGEPNSASLLVSGGLRLVGQHLEQACRHFEQIEGRLAPAAPSLAPSGAYWAPTGEHRPDPEALAPPAVIAEQGGILLIGLGGTLVVNAADERLALLSAEDNETMAAEPLPLPTLARLAAAVPTCLIRLAEAEGPSLASCRGCGLQLERPGDGSLIVRLGAVQTVIDVTTGWQFSAEVAGLLSRRLAGRTDQLLRLESALAASGQGVGR
ncbi:ribbon-helix-helix domain-containing protein [Synechococcus sp. CS-205]|uniref:ribbon-helix-helix domain-containing protein n=1 Tax=Synechococcus sp. CS-205 TaxID=2847984 RepID=UPI00223C14A6|nr:ribbon-helix-helix domain-containing protein [Synechococcus sp. CS-205]MCT0249767.1 ribbon-helix-helix domain-containing protein [Synechococcus sp. CS-205]